MKNYIKGFGIIVALLYSMTALAGGTVKVNGKEVGTAATGLDNDGNAASASIDVGSGKCTLTITPGYGKYITVNDISAIKTIDGSNAQTRTPGINTPVTITATDDTADPSGTTSYTFDVPTTNEYDYEVTANFQNRTSVDGATVEVVGGPYTYSGSAIKPDLKVTVGGVTLTKDTDYKAYYKDSINAGTNTGKVIIEGIRKYNGSKGNWGGNATADNPAATYTINPKTIADATITLTPESSVYNGQNQKPTVSVKDGNTDLLLDTDYTLTNDGGTNVGEYTITITGKGNYDPNTTATKKFTITPKSIANATITLDHENFVYNGQNQKPTVSVKDGNTDLVLDTDYTLTNDGGTNVGEYNVTITGKGNYDSKTTATKKFNITVLEKTPTVALANPDEAIVYDGTAKEPALTVSVVIKDGDAPTALTLNTDYTVVYSDNVNAGTNTAKATVTLKGNYKGTGSATFTIAPKSIGNVNISDIADQAYTGSAIQPTVTVKDGEKTLVLNTDYTISYSNNTAAAASTAENAPTVIVTGKGNYDPNTTATKKFTITPKSIANATITLDHENFVYNGQNQKPTVSVKDGNTDLVLDTDYTLTNEGGTNAGEYTVTITGKGNYDPNTKASKDFNIIVLEKTPTVALANPDEAIVYDGTAKEPAVKVSLVIKDGDEPTVLTLNTDYTVAYSDNVNAGTNTAKATVTLKGNYKGTGSGTFTIAPKSIANVSISDIADQAYTGSAIQPTVTVKDGDKTLVLNTDYTISYSNNTAAAASTAENAPTVIVTGKGNYDPNTKATKTFSIYVTTISLSYSSDKAEGKIGVAFTAPTLNNPSNVAVTYSSSNPDVATINDDGVVTLISPGETTITASFAGDGNHEPASASYKLTVAKLQAGLAWTDEGADYYLGEWWYGPRLTNPNNLKVTYKSSDEEVATIDEKGVITALALGETWIMAIFEGNEMYEPQTVRYALMVKERYDLLVNDVRVTSDNCRDILGDKHFFFDKGDKTLVVTSNDNPVSIESRMKNLTIFLNGSSKLERIFFNNEGKEENTGSLTITTYENIPGSVVLETSNANGVISGFSSLTIDDKSYTYLLDPAEGKYEGGKLVTAEGGVAMSATIGQYLKPLVDGQTVTFPPGKFGIDDFTNKVIDDILFTMVLRPDGSDEDDDFYDSVESAIVLNNLNSTSGVTMLIDNVEKDGLIPGSNEYALQFKGGITFMVPNGEGTITLNLKTEPGYKLMLMIGKSEPKEISQNERGDVQFTYNVEKATYVCVYLVQAAGTRGTRIGKRDRHHGTIYSIKVEPTKVRNMNPLGEVEGYPGNQKPEVVVHSSTGIKEIKVEPTNETSGDDSWYDMQGRKIDKPTKAGIYIQNRKKIVIK